MPQPAAPLVPVRVDLDANDRTPDEPPRSYSERQAVICADPSETDEATANMINEGCPNTAGY